jgi:GT2 family glycosyltransferase
VIGVVVVNWNDAAGSVGALRSARASRAVVRVLVDNASFEDPGPALSREIPDAVLVRRATNGGYAAGCNAGVNAALAAGASVVLVLNNDATLDDGALDRLADEEEARPGRILAPLIVYADAPATVWSAGGTVHLPMLRNHHIGLGEPVARHRPPAQVAWATGCALFFSAATWRRVGPMDEAFFLYLEDVEWCLRAGKAGIQIWTVPEATVRHAVSRTTGALPPSDVRYYAYRNLYRLAFRHAPLWVKPVVALELVWTLGKTGARWVAFPSYRADTQYHARTRAIRDAVVGRWGPVQVRAGRAVATDLASSGAAR